MKAPRILQTSLSTMGAIAALGLIASVAPAKADLFWLGGTSNGTAAASPTLAGGGNWDNSIQNWSTTSPASTPTTWASGQNAVFNGVGGTVNTTDDLSVGGVQFNATGSYSIVNANNLQVTGSITNTTASSQNITNVGILDISGTGTKISNTGLGGVTITNADALTFLGGSSSGSAVITNTGTLKYEGTSTGTSLGVTPVRQTVVTSSGAVDIRTHNAGSSVDLSSMTIQNQGALQLGANTMKMNTLTVNDGGTLNFTLGTVSGLADATGGTFTSSVAPGSITVDLFQGAGLTAGTYTLIKFGTGVGVNASDFTLGQNDLSGYAVTFSADSDSVDVNLVAVPEVSSFLMPALGAAGLFLARRRSSRAAPKSDVA